MSDSGSSQLREEQKDAESAEPPSLTGVASVSGWILPLIR